MRLLADTAATFSLLVLGLFCCLGMQQQAPVPAAPAPAVETRPVTEPERPPPASRLALPSELEAVHVAREEGRLALMLGFTSAVRFETAYSAEGNELEVIVAPVDRLSLSRKSGELERELGTVRIETSSQQVHKLTFVLPEPLRPSPSTSRAAGHGRTLLLDFDVSERPLSLFPVDAGELRDEQVLARHRGFSSHRFRWASRKGRESDVFVHRLDPARGDYRLELALPGGRIHGRAGLSKIARRSDAVAAINAGYFAINGNGDPIGLIAAGGRLMAAPIHSRAAVGVFADGRVLFGNPELSGRVETALGGGPLHGLNQERGAGELILYTSDYGTSTGSQGDGVEISAAAGKVLAVGSHDMPIPTGGFVVSHAGKAPDWLAALEPGDAVDFEYGLTPPWDSSHVAMGGGPRILRDGVPLTHEDFAGEQFSREFSAQRAPRTGVGCTPEGQLLLVTVDGRKPGRNAGVSLPELAAIFRSLGASNALNLDGGGSTTSWLANETVNSPSDGRERPISSALVVVPRHPRVVAVSDASADRG